MRVSPWLFVFVVLLLLLDSFKERHEERQIIRHAESSVQQSDIGINQVNEQFGSTTSTSDNHTFTTPQLWNKIAAIPLNIRHRFYVWTTDMQNEFIGSASGVDKQAYFANSFLVGFKPFETNSVWEPLATLSLRKSYILDHKLYGPDMSEIWQNSRQAYLNTRGDCEDHALILADWLISMGHDARVVLGNYKNGGHAWVVLFYDNKEYILEATNKRRPKSINDFLIARLATDYNPVYQFDRTRFWVNTGSKYTTQYRDHKWQLRSTFVKTNSNGFG